MASLIYKDAPGAARCGIICKLAMTILKVTVYQSIGIAQCFHLELICSTSKMTGLVSPTFCYAISSASLVLIL